jgi:hypothetical protein
MANAIEMAISAALGKMMENAPDMLGKLVANLPPDIVATIGQTAQIALSYKAQLDRIENQNRLIIAHLNIPAGTDLTEHDNAGSGIRNGSGPVGD